MSLEHLIARGKGAHPDHGEKAGNRAEDRVCWSVARGVLGEGQGIDGHIQGRDSPAAALPPLGVVCHGRDTRWLRGSGVA